MSKYRQHPHDPTRRPLAHGERVEWHFHTANQLICPGRGVLEVSTPYGRWVVPPHRAVWLPAGVPHTHRAHGPSELRCLVYPADTNPLRLTAPAVLAAPPLRDLADLLAADPADDRSLAELGRAVGAAERTLSRLFRAELGLGFPQWRTQLRLQHALVLLARGRSVTATAAACGFRSPSAFIEAFRHAFGTTPGRYQQG